MDVFSFPFQKNSPSRFQEYCFGSFTLFAFHSLSSRLLNSLQLPSSPFNSPQQSSIFPSHLIQDPERTGLSPSQFAHNQQNRENPTLLSNQANTACTSTSKSNSLHTQPALPANTIKKKNPFLPCSAISNQQSAIDQANNTASNFVPCIPTP